MKVPRTRAEALDKTVEELQAERAKSMGRVGQRLEGYLFELKALVARFAETPSSEREPLREQYRALRKEAETWRWYLEVQREALGLYRHDELYAAYPIPELR